ncbi:hypothetical protein [Mesorhizobium sp. L2C067A000]|uniref:hypothetical protein n=1 Tax=Mesorhizobium sp. L2C067A000 TaxID=1287106 RepID=UPI0004CF15EE|nr:hypothetical protein [Mesorhizobium sp. L2C067A000]
MAQRSSSILPPSTIDEKWPHQVALPDDLCTGRNRTTIHDYCQERGMTFQIRHVQAVWPNGKYEEYRLHCFADPAEAKAFLDHFQGEPFDAKRNREKGKIRGVWRRSDEYRRILDLGPLSVPELLRN